MKSLANSLARSTYDELENKTYQLLEQSLCELQGDKVNKLQELQQSRQQLNAMVEQVNDLNKIISLKENQIQQEFDFSVKQLKQQAVNHLKLQKDKIRLELREFQ